MTWRRSILVVHSSVVLLSLLLPGVAAANTITATGQQIQVTAQVKAMQYVIVDATGTIQQIITNTTDRTAEVAVYRNEVKPRNQLPLTTEISDQLAVLLKDKAIKPGVLYRRPVLAVTAPEKAVLTLLKPKALLVTI